MKFTVDYDPDSEKYFTMHNGYRLEHKRIGDLVGQLRKIYKDVGKRFPGYKATRRAQKTY